MGFVDIFIYDFVMLQYKQNHVVISCLLFFEGNKVILKISNRRKIRQKHLKLGSFN